MKYDGDLARATLDGRRYRVRGARPREAGAVLDHLEEVHARDDAPGLYAPGEFRLGVDDVRARVEGALRRPNTLFLVAVSEADGIVGSAQLDGPRWARLAHVAEIALHVRRAWRRQGVGGTLLDAAIAAAAASPLERLSLGVLAGNDAARALYASRGFQVEGVRPGHVRLAGGPADLVLMGRAVR